MDILYKRLLFFNESRITIDKEITYEHFNKTFKEKRNQIILEIKNKNIYKIYDENLNFTRYRFSKYSEGMKNLYKYCIVC